MLTNNHILCIPNGELLCLMRFFTEQGGATAGRSATLSSRQQPLAVLGFSFDRKWRQLTYSAVQHGVRGDEHILRGGVCGLSSSSGGAAAAKLDRRARRGARSGLRDHATQRPRRFAALSGPLSHTLSYGDHGHYRGRGAADQAKRAAGACFVLLADVRQQVSLACAPAAPAGRAHKSNYYHH